MNSAVIAFLTCLLVFYAQGQLTNGSSQCKCSNGYVRNDRIPRHLIKTGLVIYRPSIFCPRAEIIIKTAKRQMCVDPESPFGKRILKDKNKNKKNAAVSTTLASSSARLHTTSQL